MKKGGFSKKVELVWGGSLTDRATQSRLLSDTRDTSGSINTTDSSYSSDSFDSNDRNKAMEINAFILRFMLPCKSI